MFAFPDLPPPYECFRAHPFCADCAVCSAGYVSGLLGHCRECSAGKKRLAIGLAGTALALLIILTVWLLSRPPTVADNETRVRIRQAVSVRYKLIIGALPLSAFKIVVVVLQIITQV